MEQLISSADPAIAFFGFLQTMQALPERPLSQPRVFVSHRMADVPDAERIAWLASRKAGLEYWLDVHDPVLWYGQIHCTPEERGHFKDLVGLGLHDAFSLLEQPDRI